MKTFRARLAFWMATSALSILLLAGAAVYAGVRSTLEERQDAALLEITRTEIESSKQTENVDLIEVSASDESILTWDSGTREILLERGPVSLRASMRPASQPEFTHLRLGNREFRALYYPYEENGKRLVALCVEPSAPLQDALKKTTLQLLGIGALGTAITCLLAWLLSARLTQPLQKIAERAAEIQESALDRRLPHLSQDMELVAVTEGINAMLARLESAFAAQRRFVADAAHELRSPLANIRTTAEVALRRQDPSIHKRALQLTVSEIERLTRLTESLLALSLADAGTLVERRERLDLGAIAAEAVDAIRSRAEARGVRILLDRQPALMKGDALRLRQVFDNLLDNAVRYSPAGGCVRVGLQVQNGRLNAFVADEGEGISEADLPHLFERLWRADSARTRATGGFGLGLAIVKAIVLAHGGEIQVFSSPTEGTRFDFSFPDHAQ